FFPSSLLLFFPSSLLPFFPSSLRPLRPLRCALLSSSLRPLRCALLLLAPLATPAVATARALAAWAIARRGTAIPRVDPFLRGLLVRSTATLKERLARRLLGDERVAARSDELASPRRDESLAHLEPVLGLEELHER